MTYYNVYETPCGLDGLIMYSDGEYLTGLSFYKENSKPPLGCGYAELLIFDKTKAWLDSYFNGSDCGKAPEIRLCGVTEFCREVLELLQNVGYGQTVTYGDIAEKIAAKRGIKKMSAQAVGQALHKNPVCIIIPCHRVVGKDGSLVGYGGGLKQKEALLRLEKTQYHKKSGS